MADAVTFGTHQPGGPFDGEGEVRRLARSLDWGATSLGPVDQWPPALRTIVRTCLESPFPINLWCGPELALIYNDAYSSVLGAKHPEALGRPGAEVWSEIWGDIAPMFARIEAGGPPVYADDSPFHVERAGDAPGPVSERPTNAWFTFSLSAVRDENGSIVAYLNIVSESTRRIMAELASDAARARAERAEARLLEIFSQAPSFMAVIRGREHLFEFANEAYFELVGRRGIIGHSLDEALPDLSGQGFDKLLDEVMESGIPYVGREVSVLISRAGGGEQEERFVDFVYYPITEADGTRTGVVAHGSDVTDHVLSRRAAQEAGEEAERARQRAELAADEADAANRAKSEFLANMSHEIRTPINAIVGYTDLLELEIPGPVTEKQREQLARIRLSGQHLRALIDDVLDLSKAEAGGLTVSRNVRSVSEAVARALDLVGPQTVGKVRIHNDCGGDLAYFGDEDRVRQILVNLLSNAIKFTPHDGEIRIRCGGALSPAVAGGTLEAGDYTCIEVSDTGIGIPEARLESIFQPFFQIESGHTRTRGGTGLGLTISRYLARMMGGDLTVRSEIGSGSTFTLWLPRQPVGEPLVEAIIERKREDRPRGLSRFGSALKKSIDEILDAFNRRLRHDPLIPRAGSLRYGEVVDHVASFLTDVGQSLASLDDDDADVAQMLRDGSEIQQLISRLHGAQRARLGWTESALRREFFVLRGEILRAVRPGTGESGTDGDDIAGLLTRILSHAERASVQGFRAAMQSDAASGLPLSPETDKAEDSPGP